MSIAGKEIRNRAALPVRLNLRMQGMQCLKCAETLAVGDFFEGCPGCYSEGGPSSLEIAQSEHRRVPFWTKACAGHNSVGYTPPKAQPAGGWCFKDHPPAARGKHR